MGEKDILVILTDEKERRYIANQILEPDGFEVTTCSLGEVLKYDTQPYDLILLGDIRERQSLVIASSLIEQFPASPLVVVLKPGADSDLVQEALRLGVFACLPPPLRAQDLLAVLTRGLERRRQLQRWADSLAAGKIKAFRDRLAEVEAISQAGKSVASALDLDQVLANVVEAAVALTGAEEGSLLLLDDQSDHLYIRAAFNFKEEYARTLRLPVQDSLAGRALRHGKPLIFGKDEPAKIKTHYLVHALIYAPMVVNGKPIGVLGVDNRQLKQSQFNDQDAVVMSALADFAAIAIENARRYTQAETERKKLETMLREVADGVILIDDSLDILLMNNSALKIFQLDGGGYSGKNFGQVIDHQELIEVIYDPTQDAPRKIDIELDDERYYVAQVTPVEGIGKVVTLQDVSHFRELDNIKNEFVHTVSHDLRSPLTAILGYVELIGKVGETSERQKEYIRRVEASVKNITDLINALLELGRIEAGFDRQREPVPIPVLVQYAVDGMQHLMAQKGLALRVQMPDGLPPVFGNTVRLRQVVNNLIENALKYTPAGGEITISARQEGAQVILQVQDTGVGIPPDDQPYIFDKLYRAGNIPVDSPGSGLGLSIVKSIVDHHGGRLWFDSVMDQGTTFTVVLPAAGIHLEIDTEQPLGPD